MIKNTSSLLDGYVIEQHSEFSLGNKESIYLVLLIWIIIECCELDPCF